MTPNETQGLAETRACNWCGTSMAPNARRCPECKLAQGPLCVVCKEPLPLDAKRCNACDNYQGYWWQRIPKSGTFLALTALASVISTGLIPVVSYFRGYHSHTSLIVTNVDSHSVYLYAWNTGRQPSTLIRFVLDFGDLPIENTKLEPIKDDRAKTVIAPGANVTIELQPAELTQEAKTPNATTPRSPTLFIEVEESDESRRTLKVELPVDLFDEFARAARSHT